MELVDIPLLSLDLSFNSSLAEHCFGQGCPLPSTLLSLNLNNVGLSSIPDIIFELIQLQQLLLAGNTLSKNNSADVSDLTKCPWPRLQHLRELSLASCGLCSMPVDLHCMPVLEIVDVSNNNITDIPPIISLSQSLKVLRLNGNGLKSIRYDVVRAGTAAIMSFLGKKLPDEYQEDVQRASDARQYGKGRAGHDEDRSSGASSSGGSDRAGTGSGGSGSGNGSGSREGDEKIRALDEEMEGLSLQLQNASKMQKYALDKKFKMLKAKRIRAVREAQKSSKK